MEPEQDAHVIEQRATRTWVGRDGIVRAQVRPGAEFTRADSVAALNATRILVPNLPALVIVDCSDVRSADRESRLYFESPEAKGTLLAMAIVFGSPVSRMIVSFFMRLVRPDFKVGIFSSEEDAASWLRGLAAKK